MKKKISLLVTAILFLCGWISCADAQSFAFYVTDTFPDNVLGIPDDGKTILWRVNFDALGHANLYQLDAFPAPYGADVAALATTPTGDKLVAWDYETGYAWMYYPGTDTLSPLDQLKLAGTTTPFKKSAQGAYSLDGVLYATRATDSSLYWIELGTQDVHLIGQIRTAGTNQLVNIPGADIVFTPDGALYIWCESPQRGLFQLIIPSSPGTVWAYFVGPISGAPSGVRGLAASADDPGYVYAAVGPSDTEFKSGNPLPDKSGIYKVSTVDGSVSLLYPMYQGGDRYLTYGRGDAAAGPLVVCTKTIGYYKNHSWDGKIVTICGIEIDEDYGKVILHNARGNNFSMLFAQLIAALLNTNDNTNPYSTDIQDTLDWLCIQSGIQDGYGNLLWDTEFESKSQKKVAGGYWETLDEFNNLFECN